MRRSYLFIVLTFLALPWLNGCGGGNSQGSGTLQLGITDAPVDGAEEVVIHFTGITLHHDGGESHIRLDDPPNTPPGRSIDLLALQGGQWTGLIDEITVAGHYSWIRLELDLDKSYIKINGQQFGLRCTSCDNNGYKLVSSFDVPRDAVLALMMDFDLRKSITDPSNSGTDYILRPTLRTIETAASGKIEGSVDASLVTQLGGPEGCAVYVYDGSDAVADDVFIPFDSQSIAAESHVNPVSTARINGDGTYTYTASFIPAGEYTVALTCGAKDDNAATDDDIVFVGNQNVTVTAGATSPINFMLPIASP